MSFVSYLVSVVQGLSQADLLVISGLLAYGIQELINKYLGLGSTLKWVVSFPLPTFTAFITFLAAYGHFNLQQGGLAYLLAQLVFFTVEKLKEQGAKSAVPETVVL
jgi:hypothetical protein